MFFHNFINIRAKYCGILQKSGENNREELTFSAICSHIGG
jgi:hypothetical protein